MYSEKTYKNYIFWVQVKRVIVIILLSCLGAAIGVLIGKILESTVKVTSFNNAIIAVSTIIFFLLAILLTVGTGKQVQDGYWRIAVLRKLTVIQKNLELNNELLKGSDKYLKENMISINSKVSIVDDELKEDDYTDDLKDEETSLKVQTKIPKKKTPKTIKKPEELN